MAQIFNVSGLNETNAFFFFKDDPVFCCCCCCFLIYLFLFLAVLGLCFCTRTFSSCGKWGPLFIAVRRPLTFTASLVAEHRLQTRRLSSCGSRAQLLHGMWDLPDQGSNPCPLHWQADSQPLHHQGSPETNAFLQWFKREWQEASRGSTYNNTFYD